MASLRIVPFDDYCLDEAAALLAARHRRDRAHEPALRERFSQPAGARASLGLVPLAGLCEDTTCDGEGGVAPSLVERGAAYLQRRRLLLGNYAALARCKGEFQPAWEPRYLVVADRAALPSVLRAMAYVHSYTSRSILKEAALASLTPESDCTN